LDGVVADAIPAGGGLEGEGKRKGVLLLLLLSGIDAEIIITFEVVGFRLLSNEGDAHDKSLTMLLSVTVA
jgi:hypothetical protein